MRGSETRAPLSRAQREQLRKLREAIEALNTAAALSPAPEQDEG
jgi:hypothetical protein